MTRFVLSLILMIAQAHSYEVVIKRLSNFKVIKIEDIAEVKFDKVIRTGAATVNEKNPSSVLGLCFWEKTPVLWPREFR